MADVIVSQSVKKTRYGLFISDDHHGVKIGQERHDE